MNQAIQQKDVSQTEKLASIENSLSDARAKLKSEASRRRAYLIIAGIAALPIGLHYGQLLSLPVWLLVTAGLVVFTFLFASLGVDLEKPRVEIEKLEASKRLYLDFLNIKPGEEYFDSLVKINIENLAEYYALVQIQSRRSFNLSSVVAVIGFLLIAVGLAVGFTNESLRNISYLSAASGVIIEFIASVFFYLYNKTVLQLKAYHDSLLDVQNILLSFKLIEGTKDEKERSAMTQRMIEFLATRKAVSKGK